MNDHREGCSTACGDHGPHRTYRKFLWCETPGVHHSIQLIAEYSQAGTMFELSGVLDQGTQQLTDRVPNSISLNAGCELFNLFVTVATHDLGVCTSLPSTKSPTHTVPSLEPLRLQGQTCPAGEPVHHRGRLVQREDRFLCQWICQGWIGGMTLSCVLTPSFFSHTLMLYYGRSSHILTPGW